MFLTVAMSVEDLMRAIDVDASDRAGRCASNISSFNFDTGTLNFITRCSGSRNSWQQRIVVGDWDVVLTDELKQNKLTWDQFKVQFPEILNSDVRVGCTCPWFQMGGPAYILDQFDAGELSLTRYKNTRGPEGRYPSMRDPDLDHTLCKHLIAVLRKYFK
ncbi:MAG: SWIM zinc finger family protein [Candidatus Paceibacterota bacterium]